MKQQADSKHLHRLIKACLCLSLIILSGQNIKAQCGSSEVIPSIVCENAPLICLQSWCTETTFDPPPSPMQGFCGNNTALHNPQFYEFVALDTEVEFRIRIGTCQGGQNALQGAIIDTCPWTSISEVIECDPGTPEGSLMVLNFSGAIPGKSYWIVIDGSAGSTCEYSFESVSGIYMPQLIGELSPDSTLLSSDIIFPGIDVLEMSIGPEVLNAHGYYWVTGWNGDTVYSSVPNFTFDIPCEVMSGLYSICAGAYSGCDVTETEMCASVFIQSDKIFAIKGTSIFCPDTFPFAWFDVEISGPGSYVQLFQTSFGCVDSLWFIEAYPSSTASICCDQTLCDTCTEIDIALSGFPPWNIYLTSDQGTALYANVTDTLTSIPVCPPKNSVTPYWFVVTDNLQNCNALIEGEDTVTIVNRDPPEIMIVYMDEVVCAFAEDAVSYQWTDCATSEVLGTSQCIITDLLSCFCVNITTVSGCENETCEILFGQEELSTTSQIKVYPQPANGNIYVELPDQLKLPVHWMLSDLAGKSVTQGVWYSSVETLNQLEALDRGVYILQCRDHTGQTTAVKILAQ